MEEEELILSSAAKPNIRKKSLPNRQREPISPAVRRPVPPPRREPLLGVAISVDPPSMRGRVPVDYYHMDAKLYSKMRSEENEFLLPGTATDVRFHTLVQQDIYATVFLEINATTPQKFINLEYFEQHPEKFGTLIRLVDAMGLRHALTLKCDWSHGAILQFYATCTFSIDDFLSLRTHQQTISISYNQWCEALGMPTRSDALYRIHSRSSEFESMSIDACMGCMMRPADIPPGKNMVK